MTPLRPHHWIFSALCALFVLGSLSCKSDPPDPDSLPAWSFQSTKAPYSVEVPGQWTQTPTEDLNRFADLAVRVEEQYYLIIIPQELPQYEGVASPDALDLKRASLGVLKERVSDFEVTREGPLQLSGQPALSVFATGVHEDEPVQYINTYATHDNWGFQVIAWGAADHKSGLVDATDKLLAGWKFEGASSDKTPDSEQAETPEIPTETENNTK